MSPIRAENRDRYPDDWPEISRGIKDRAGWRCECRGECGRGTHEGRCPNRHGQPAYGTGSTVVLTTAHLDHTPERCDPDNLRAMCQGCHLHYDRDHHAETRRATREAALGLVPLPGIDDVVLCTRECDGYCSAQWCALADDLDDELGTSDADLEHLRALLLGPRTTTIHPNPELL